MKIIGIGGTALLSLLLALAGPVNAQQERQGEKQDHPQQQQSKQQQTKPEAQHAQPQRQPAKKEQQSQRAQQQQRQDQSKQTQQRAQQQQRQDQSKQTQQRAQQQQRQDQSKQTQQRAQQQQRPERTQEQQRVERSAWQEHRSHNWQSDHRNWQQRGGYNGYRIPDDRFRGYFGRDHGFHIYGLPFLVVGGFPRFQYEGYWFSMVDPWPEYWGNDWYDTDDVYVTYVDNGYYLFNRRYPETGIAISISM